MADKALVSTQTGKPRKLCIRNWPALCVGGVFCTGGLGWCLHTALKLRPDNWKTTLAAFVVGATGITITHAVLFDAYSHARRGRQRKDPLPQPAPELMEVEPQARFSIKLENLTIPESVGLVESEVVLYEKVCQALSKKISEAKHTNCSSCWSLCNSVYEALHEFKMGYVHCKPTPELCDLLQIALREYRGEHGYRNVAKEYRTAIDVNFSAFQEKISSNFKEFGIYAERVLLNRELPSEVQTVSVVPEDLASKLYLAQELSEDSIRKVVEMVNTLTLCLNRNFDAEVGEFISSVYRTLEPPIKCPAELEFKRQIDRALLVRN